ncbi:peptidylprolyl isomerase [Paraglaciecola sp. L1A13]|uniref:FKBP-type peptidyl-prolyl cis-trans isomerase n=1 Tax=Paraglaciecola sp. L1A13 TaxID=2686359 RepID=UPI00131B2C3A|nr:peptidylprolyl isomerase [Paraglaciecola sp. L1A13]
MQIAKDTVVQFKYIITDLDGVELENNRDDEAVAYLHGHSNMMPGVAAALEGKAVGDRFSVELEPAQTYGEIQPDAEQRIPMKHLQDAQGTKKWKAGMTAVVNTENGQREVTVVKVGKFMVTVNLNHPMAGKTLNFDLEVVDVRQATSEEIEHGHAHGAGGHHH